MRSKEREKLKRVILLLIDENRDPLIKMTFYKDSYVTNLLEQLYQRWKTNGERGIPLDYATDDELKKLVFKAQYYYRSSPRSLIYETPRKQSNILHKLINFFNRIFK